MDIGALLHVAGGGLLFLLGLGFVALVVSALGLWALRMVGL